MDAVWGFIQSSFWVVLVVIALVVIAAIIKVRYKVPGPNEALVITGGRKGLRVLPGNGAFVSPLYKVDTFPLAVMTVRSDDQETQTSTLVPVVVQWTAQLKADVDTDGALIKAVQGFSGLKTKGDDGTEEIAESLTRTLDGEVRAVVATMTPEEVIRDKAGFSQKVEEGVKERMEELGFKLVSLNIATVTDRNGHYHNLAAADREEKRRSAEKLTAEANKDVSVAQAAADQASKAAEQQRDLAVSEQRRELALRQAAIKAETDQAQADAAIAGELQTELRNQELAARKGEVGVIEEQQRQSTAAARRNVEVTEAETAKQTREINAAADGRTSEIEAEAAAAVARARATGEAEAAKARASGEAEAVKAKAAGEADAVELTATAEANRIRQTGLAQAEIAKAQGEAEATAILAKGQAEAEVQRLMADALAANNGANLQVTLAEIQRDTTVTVYTAVGEAMARIGEHATFIDMGGSSNGGGDLLSSVLGNVPELLKRLDVKSTALSGVPFGQLVNDTASAITGQSRASEVVAAVSPSEAPAAEEAPVLDAAQLAAPVVELVADKLGVDSGVVSDLAEAALAAGTAKMNEHGKRRHADGPEGTPAA